MRHLLASLFLLVLALATTFGLATYLELVAGRERVAGPVDIAPANRSPSPGRMVIRSAG